MVPSTRQTRPRTSSMAYPRGGHEFLRDRFHDGEGAPRRTDLASTALITRATRGDEHQPCTSRSGIVTRCRPSSSRLRSTPKTRVACTSWRRCAPAVTSFTLVAGARWSGASCPYRPAASHLPRCREGIRPRTRAACPRSGSRRSATMEHAEGACIFCQRTKPLITITNENEDVPFRRPRSRAGRRRGSAACVCLPASTARVIARRQGSVTLTGDYMRFQITRGRSQDAGGMTDHG